MFLVRKLYLGCVTLMITLLMKFFYPPNLKKQWACVEPEILYLAHILHIVCKSRGNHEDITDEIVMSS